MRRDPTSLEIDGCLRMLLGNCVVTPNTLNFLVESYGVEVFAKRRNTMLKVITKRLICCIREGCFSRWDFDPWDEKRMNQPLSDLPEVDHFSELWIKIRSDRVKKGVLTAIASHYREECRSLAEILRNKFALTKDFMEVSNVLRLAMGLGVLEGNCGKVHHNHSFINSKLVFATYEDALHRVP